MSRYFKLSELLYSSTAERLHIVNTPNKEEMEHLEELMIVLDDLRSFYGKPIIVSSGFRCKALNDAVGGAKNSGHLTGYAADLQPANGDFEGFKKACLAWAKDKHYDELLIESNSKGSKWIHFSLYHQVKEQRRKCFSLSVK